jgi:hypothetical protein
LRWLIAVLTAYGAISFIYAAVSGATVGETLSGRGRFQAIPYVLQGTFIGGFVILPLGWIVSVVQIANTVFRKRSPRPGWFQAIALTTCVAMLPAAVLLPTANSFETPESPEAVKQYGYGPRPDPRVRYQPDVVLIGGGANSIRGVSDDGLTWTIDGNSPGARDLSVGKIMFATSRAVGRVLAIDARGKDMAVTLGPARFTDIIRDAEIDIPKTKLRPENFAAFGSAPAGTVLHLGMAPSDQPRVELAVFHPRESRPQLQPAGWKVSGKLSVGDWEFEPYYKTSSTPWYKSDPDTPPPLFGDAPENSSPGKQEDEQSVIGIKVQKKLTKGEFGGTGRQGKTADGRSLLPDSIKYGLKFGADIRLIGKDIRTYGHISVSNGQFAQPPTFVIEGIDTLAIGLLGGEENGSADNVKLRFEIPMEQAFQIPPIYGPIPLAIHLKMKFLVETAFSGANSTLWATGEYGLSGPIGIVDGNSVTPSFTVKKPMINDIGGVTVGVSGVVVASEFRWLLGFGNELFMFGPYAKMTVAVGTSRGSFVGGQFALLYGKVRPVIDCRGVTLKGDLGVGVGLVINEGLAAILDKYHLKTDSEFVEKSTTFVNSTVVSPVSKLCSDSGG